MLPGLDVPVDRPYSWTVLWKLKVYFLADSVGEGVIEGSFPAVHGVVVGR
jgi:hypothetical protein